MDLLTRILNDIFFSGWEPILEAMLTAVLAYVMFIIVLRISGKRTLSKMSIFDFIVTIALGSVLAGVIIDNTITIFQGVMAAATLVIVQFFVTFTAVRWEGFGDFMRAEPRILFYQGQFLERDMKKERFTTDDVYAAIREAGIADLEDVEAVVLEANGSPSVIKRKDGRIAQSSLTHTCNYEQVVGAS